MKRFFKVLFTFSLGLALAAGCAKEYDDTALKSKVDALSAEVNTLKANQQAMQAVIDVWKKGGYIASIDNSVPGQHTITFYGTEGKTVVLYDGAQGPQGPQGAPGAAGTGGDSYFKNVVTNEDGVTFTMNDEKETSFTIPFAKAFKLVIENPQAEVAAGEKAEFPYTVQNANSTTTVDVFAGGNYAAVVNETDKKIEVTAPTPAAPGSVLVWAQNEEGLMSMRKLSFTVKAETSITTEVEEYQAITADAQEVVVNVVSNVDIEVPQPDVDWVTVAVTKADYKLTFTLAENTTGEPREAVIKINRADTGAQVQEFKIIQTATKSEPAVKKMTMSDIQDLCTSSSNAQFVGEFEGLYVNYILGTQHIYLEDESGALRYYSEKGNTVKIGGEDHTLTVGDKISGVISGMCRLDSGRPTINYLDFTNATVEAAPAEEQPKPVTGTLGSFTDVQGLMYRRVTLEKVVLDANLLKDKSSQKITISDGTGSIQLHLRFDPKQNIPQGNRVSGTGTFDVDNGKLEIRVFSLADVTEVLPPPALTVERLWGKYSNSTAAWNAYYGGTANSDRNLAMDDDYIFVQESTAAAKIWKIPVDGTTAPSNVNVEGVSGGTHAVSCIRMVPNTAAGVNGGKDFLMGVSLTIDDSATPMKVYSWGNGVDSKPTATSASTYCNRRLGDKFTVYGSLQDGALFFKDYNNASEQGAFLVLRMAWSEVPGDGFFNPRRTNMFVEGGMGAYYPLPGNASKGLYTSTASAKFAQFTDSPLSVSDNKSGAFADAGGYYVDAHGFNCFEFNGKRYIAYVKNAGSGDGRFYVLEGDSTTDWADMLGSKRKVIYQACIQEDLAYTDGEYHADMAANPSPKTSGNSGIDCAIRVKSDGVYFAVMKQHVGLSLFKMSMK